MRARSPRGWSRPDMFVPGMRALALIALGACGGARLQPLPADATAPGPAAGLGRSSVLARGALTYAVAFAGRLASPLARAPARPPTSPPELSSEVSSQLSSEVSSQLSPSGRRDDHDLLVAIELATEFELVVRELGPRGASRVRHRIALGPPDFDVGDLAVDHARHEAWIASRDGTVRSYDLTSGALVLAWHLGSPATAVAISADGRLVTTATDDGILCLRRRQDSALLQCVVAHEAPIAALDFAHARDRLASAAWDGTVIVWDVPSLAIVMRERYEGSINDLAFAPDGARLALARSKSRPVRAPRVHESGSDARAASDLALVSVWDVRARTRRDLRGHGDVVTSVGWLGDGRRLVSASWDRSVALWDAQTGVLVARHTGFAGLVRDVAVDARGTWVAAGAWSDAGRLQESTATALIELLYATRSRSTMQAGD